MKYGSFSNQLISSVKPSEPQIGDGATLILWSDRQAYTVTDVKKSYVVISRDKYSSGLRKAYLRKDGNYYLGGHLLKIGFREEYYDPHF
jgi:hypothetical protein